jgi:hypothetical protein
MKSGAVSSGKSVCEIVAEALTQRGRQIAEGDEDGVLLRVSELEKVQKALHLLMRWQGAMRFSGVTAAVKGASDNNPVAELIRDTDAILTRQP